MVLHVIIERVGFIHICCLLHVINVHVLYSSGHEKKNYCGTVRTLLLIGCAVTVMIIRTISFCDNEFHAYQLTPFLFMVHHAVLTEEEPV